MTTRKKVTRKSKKDQPRVLTEVEMLKIDNLTKSRSIAELEILAMKQKKQILDLEFEKDLNKKHNEYKRSVDSKSKFVELLKEKFNIKEDTFSYDPITGEIKDE